MTGPGGPLKPKAAAIAALRRLWPESVILGRLVLHSADVWLTRGVYVEQTAGPEVNVRPVLIPLPLPRPTDIESGHEFVFDRSMGQPLTLPSSYEGSTSDDALARGVQTELEPWFGRVATPSAISSEMARERYGELGGHVAAFAFAVLVKDQASATTIRRRIAEWMRLGDRSDWPWQRDAVAWADSLPGMADNGDDALDALLREGAKTNRSLLKMPRDPFGIVPSPPEPLMKRLRGSVGLLGRSE